MDRKVANNVIVGIFISLGLVAFLFFLFNMGGGSGLMSSQLILYGKFDQVKGLHQGSEVSLSGLRIGVVKDIKVSSENSKELLIQMGITKKFADKIREDSMAYIRTQGVLGDKYIEISIGSEGQAPLKHNSFIKTGEQPDLFTKSGDLVSGIAQHFEKQGDFAQLLKNLNSLSGNLVKLTSEVEKQKGLVNELFYGTSGAHFNKSVSHLESILAKVDRGEGTIGSLINDPSVYEDLRSMLGGAKRSTILKYFMRQFIESGEKPESPKK